MHSSLPDSKAPRPSHSCDVLRLHLLHAEYSVLYATLFITGYVTTGLVTPQLNIPKILAAEMSAQPYTQGSKHGHETTLGPEVYRSGLFEALGLVPKPTNP